jgi:D-alanyl-D-alanine carboxypeptidase (penicillin-binding protein 5/6)
MILLLLSYAFLTSCYCCLAIKGSNSRATFIITFFIYQTLQATPPEFQSEAIILMNGQTGRVLYEKNGEKPLFPASVTKMATCAYILHIRGEKIGTLVEVEREAVAMVTQEAKRRSNFTLPSFWLEPGASHMGLKIGEKISIEDLLHGAMLASAGDACNQLALYIGGTVPDFMADLNEYLKSLGLKKTHFNNPNGLHHPKHITTAYDLALLTKGALTIPKFREMVKKLRHSGANSTVYQTNRLLKKGPYYYTPAIGVKTGYTQAAGFCLAAAAEKEGRLLICTLMGSPTRDVLYKEAKALFEMAFSETKKKATVLKAGKVDTELKLPGGSVAIQPILTKDLVIEFYPMEEPKVTCQMHWDAIQLPVKKGERVAELVVLDEEKRELRREPLFAEKDVKISFWQKIKNLLF